VFSTNRIWFRKIRSQITLSTITKLLGKPRLMSGVLRWGCYLVKEVRKYCKRLIDSFTVHIQADLGVSGFTVPNEAKFTVV
jgi:hypothetical protein